MIAAPRDFCTTEDCRGGRERRHLGTVIIYPYVITLDSMAADLCTLNSKEKIWALKGSSEEEEINT